MAFSKKPKLCVDAPASLQHLNGLSDNLESLKTDLSLEHSPPYAENEPANNVQPGGGTYVEGEVITDLTVAVTPGLHDHPLIPRGVAFVQQVVAADPSLIDSYGVQLYSYAGCLQAMQVLDTGVYFFPISGFTKVWGRVTPLADASLTGLTVDARVQPGTPSGSGSTGLVVRTFRIQDPDGVNDIMYAFHTGFFLWAYGRRDVVTAAPTGPGIAGAARRSRFSPGPMIWFPSKGK